MLNQTILSRVVRSFLVLTVVYLALGFFKVSEASDLFGIKGEYLVLKKSALGTDILLRASVIEQSLAPTSEGSLSRVVYFQRRGSKVFLMESPKGHVVTSDLPAQIILAEIPVVRETKNTLVLNFNEGMKRVFTASNWHSSDSSGRQYEAGNSSTAMQASHSFVDSIFENEKNEIEIRQILQIDVEHYFFPSYEVRYYLSAYQPDESFEIKQNPRDLRHLMYFETAPILTMGSAPGQVRTTVPTTRWGISKAPVVFHISSNTPPDFVDAVREGIVYWNKAFGFEALKAEMAPEGVSAPDSRYNLIQWVPNDSAGFAYADALSDPRTGETLNAQVYMTSLFAFRGKERIRRLLRSMREVEPPQEPESEPTEKQRHQHIKFPKFLQPRRLCDLNVTKNLRNALEFMVGSDMDDDSILKAAQDYVRSTVAHEVGHTLGLRHNFLGHTSLRVSQKERDSAFFKYINEKEDPDPAQILPSNSVMDYLDFRDDVLTGRLMLTMDQALPHDKLAIDWGYSNNSVHLVRDHRVLFCTDSHVDENTWLDCERFGSGAKPIETNAAELQKALLSIPQSIVERYIDAKYPLDARDAIPINQVVLDTDEKANIFASLVGRQLAWLSSSARSAIVERNFAQVSVQNTEAIEKNTWEWVKGQIEEQGGVEKVFFSLAPLAESEEDLSTASDQKKSDWAQDAKEGLQAYLEHIRTAGISVANSHRGSLSNDEISYIQKHGEEFIDKLKEATESALLSEYLKARVDLERSVERGAISPNGPSAEFEKLLSRVAEKILLDTTDQAIAGRAEVENKKAPTGKFSMLLAVPIFTYDFEDREKAVQLLQHSIGASNEWSLSGRRDVLRKYKDLIENSLGRHVSDIKLAQFDRPVLSWVSEQGELFGALSAQPGCADILTDGTGRGNEERLGGDAPDSKRPSGFVTAKALKSGFGRKR